MFNILTDKMPTEVLGCKIHTDVGTCLRALELIDDVLIEDELRGAGLLHLMFLNEYPQDIKGALDGLVNFLSCDNNTSNYTPDLSCSSERQMDTSDETTCFKSNQIEVGEEVEKEKAFDYVIDSSVIYSSLKSFYGYTLKLEELHWYEFNVLLLNMKDTPFNDIVYYRTCDINKLPEYQRKEYRAIRNKVRLPKKVDENYIENIKLLYPDDWKVRVEKEVLRRRNLIN